MRVAADTRQEGGARPWWVAGGRGNSTDVACEPNEAATWKEPLQVRQGGGRHIVVRSDGPYAENSLDKPRPIVPQEQMLPGCGARFPVTLAPHSVNVLRIPASDK
jgi:hypothetical protein